VNIINLLTSDLEWANNEEISFQKLYDLNTSFQNKPRLPEDQEKAVLALNLLTTNLQENEARIAELNARPTNTTTSNSRPVDLCQEITDCNKFIDKKIDDIHNFGEKLNGDKRCLALKFILFITVIVIKVIYFPNLLSSIINNDDNPTAPSSMPTSMPTSMPSPTSAFKQEY
jgi:hypothetical protein